MYLIRLIAYFSILALYACGCVAGIVAGCDKRTIAVFAAISLFCMFQLYTY